MQRLSYLRVHQLGVEPPRDDRKVLLVICARAAVEQLLALVFVEHVAADVEHLHAGGAHLQEGLDELLALAEEPSRALLNALGTQSPYAPRLRDLDRPDVEDHDGRTGEAVAGGWRWWGGRVVVRHHPVPVVQLPRAPPPGRLH